MLLMLAMLAQGPMVTPQAGMVITRSTKLRPGVYRLAADSLLDRPLITVRGDNITLDLTGVTLEGIAPDSSPDLATGVAIRVDSGSGVRIRGGRVRGYRFGVLARGTRGLELSGMDLSHTWKPRLFSLVEHESLVDWLSFHRNDRGEWLRFGAAIYLDGVRGAVIRGNKAKQGMNGLLMTRTDSTRVMNNDFSFNSGLGIGLYRSSHNHVMYNVVEFNVRGYSHGRYRRGQDSAGILMYEQSSNNVVAWNTVTHGGDGLFLWAGQTTMDSGTGGANDNLFFGNDFSYAPTNGMEATFSRNSFINNRVVGNDHGLWGGYSFNSVVANNQFANNRIGIAIEHGQDNAILQNSFSGDTTAISLWANPIEPSDWGYPRHRDTRSRDYAIGGNTFSGNRVALRAANTSNLRAAENQLTRVDSAFVMRDSTRVDSGGMGLPRIAAPDPMGGPGRRPDFLLAGRDRSAIVIDDWGPYDWRSPKLWPVDSTRAVPLRLAVLGPAGRWRVVERRGLASVSKAAGTIGDTISVTPADAADWALDLEYRGGPTETPRGRLQGANLPYRFSYGRFEPAADWAIRFFTWSDSTDPRTRSAEFGRLLAGTPLLERRAPRLDYMWYRPAVPGLPQERFALEATSTVALPDGAYTLRTISDDGIRVWVDGVLVIDNWSLHESAVDLAPLSGGRHELKVQFFQVSGWTELRLDIVRGHDRSRGSAGPH